MLLDQFCKQRQALFDFFKGYAVTHPHIAGATKFLARYYKKVQRLGLFREGEAITTGNLYE